MPDAFEEMLNAVHKDITLFDQDGAKVPCIVVKPDVFEQILKSCYGKPAAIDSSLNILHDGVGHVFVEVLLQFHDAGLKQKFLLYANDSLEFFECLALSGMIALAPAPPGGSDLNIFMVQLPRKDAAEKALEMIKSYMKEQG